MKLLLEAAAAAAGAGVEHSRFIVFGGGGCRVRVSSVCDTPDRAN